jgi:hypothetical protein
MRATSSVFTTEYGAIWLRPATPQYMVRRYKNAEHVVTDNHLECYSRLGIGRRGNKWLL